MTILINIIFIVIALLIVGAIINFVMYSIKRGNCFVNDDTDNWTNITVLTSSIFLIGVYGILMTQFVKLL
jgi:hypothetical protein